MPKKMVRFSVPSMIFRSPLARRRSRSCSGGSLMKSSWPESSAAVRAAADLIGVNTTSSTLPPGLSHHASFFVSVAFASGCHETSLYGPVPLALREAKFSSLAL
jgi:hypothetical protein